MNYVLAILLPPLTAFLDRWGGGGYSKLPWPFNGGFKLARRIFLPAVVWLQNMTFENALTAVLLGAVLSLNLDEIENRNWDEIFLYGLALAACLYPIAGVWSLLPGAWWIIGIYLSNFELTIAGKPLKKLDWFWVELVRGLLIGLSRSIAIIF